MIRLFLLSERQMARISPYFPLSHGVPRVDDRRVVSGIVSICIEPEGGATWALSKPTSRFPSGSCNVKA
jgi:hypothetical protein